MTATQPTIPLTDHQLAQIETTACQVTDAISRDTEPPDLDVAQLAEWLLDLVSEVRQARAFRSQLVVMHRETSARLAEMEYEDSSGPRWVSFDEAARYSGISARTLRSWAAKGTLRAYRVGTAKQVQIDLRDLDRLRQPVPAETIHR